MKSKKVDSTTASAKDIDSLFSRAGMIGAKYREFARASAAPLPDTARAKFPLTENPLPSRPPLAVSADLHVVPAVAPTAPALLPGPVQPSPVPPRSTPANAWTSLERIFANKPVEANLLRPACCGAKVAILSLAGGVGKTMLAVNLARIVSGYHKQVLVADCALFPSIAHHFGPPGQRIGPFQFFHAPACVTALPVGVFRQSLAELGQRDFQDVVEQVQASDGLLLMDIPSFQSDASTEVLAYADHVVIPVTPDVHSVGSLLHLQQMIENSAAAGEVRPKVYYLLNRFDEGRALHREVRGRLQQMLGNSLLPTAIREDAAVAEALAHGLTIVDYRPEAAIVRELTAVGEWMRGLVQSEAVVRQGSAV